MTPNERFKHHIVALKRLESRLREEGEVATAKRIHSKIQRELEFTREILRKRKAKKKR